MMPEPSFRLVVAAAVQDVFGRGASPMEITDIDSSHKLGYNLEIYSNSLPPSRDSHFFSKTLTENSDFEFDH